MANDILEVREIDSSGAETVRFTLEKKIEKKNFQITLIECPEG